MDNILLPIPSATMLANAKDQIEGIQTASGMTEQQFEAFCIPVLRAYANFVQNLPLLPDVYRSPGGAWQFGLTAAMVAYRYASSLIFFPKSESEERRILEPTCRYMAFLATLCSGIAITAGASRVTAGGESYHPLVTLDPLSTWLTTHSDSTFQWRSPPHSLSPQVSAAIAMRVLPRGLLESFDQKATLMLFDSIAPRSSPNGLETTLSRVVRETIGRVSEHYRLVEAKQYQSERPGLQVTKTDAEKLASSMMASATVKPPVPEDDSDDGTVDAPRVAAQTRAAAQSKDAADFTDEDANACLRNAQPALREWFAALAQHKNSKTVLEHVQITPQGIEVPIKVLGLFGVTSPVVKKLLEESELVLGRSEDSTSLILLPALRAKFVPQVASAAAAVSE